MLGDIVQGWLRRQVRDHRIDSFHLLGHVNSIHVAVTCNLGAIAHTVLTRCSQHADNDRVESREFIALLFLCASQVVA